jgi:hypothetical protein
VNIEDLAALRDDLTTIDGQRPERLTEIRDRVRVARRRRTTTRASAVVTALAAAALVVVVAQQSRHTTPEPAGPPRPDVPGGEVFAPDPFLPDGANGWGVRRQVGASLPRLSHCITDPRTWGATKARSATYVGPRTGPHGDGPAARVNEYLLEYADAASADDAFRQALGQARRCQDPSDPYDDPNVGTEVHPRADYDEGFAQQATPGGASPTNRVYALRVARAGNVLVVVEDTGITTDQSPTNQSVAVDQAMPLFRGDPNW